MDAPAWTLALAKEDFKFSVAHFTLFGPERAETLHGHNYRVAIELTGPALDAAGLLVDTLIGEDGGCCGGARRRSPARWRPVST